MSRAALLSRPSCLIPWCLLQPASRAKTHLHVKEGLNSPIHPANEDLIYLTGNQRRNGAGRPGGSRDSEGSKWQDICAVFMLHQTATHIEPIYGHLNVVVDEEIDCGRRGVCRNEYVTPK